MNAIETNLPGVLILEPKVFGDARGFFMESFNADQFAKLTGIHTPMVQDNHSRSSKGVLRGIHYQLPPMAQGKLVRAVAGEIFDVAIDIRKSSPHYGQWTSVTLSADNKKQLWVPAGFAHAFLVLSHTAEVIYKVTEYYSPKHERGLKWDDPALGIPWPDLGAPPILSAKDAVAPALKNAEVFE